MSEPHYAILVTIRRFTRGITWIGYSAGAHGVIMTSKQVTERLGGLPSIVHYSDAHKVFSQPIGSRPRWTAHVEVIHAASFVGVGETRNESVEHAFLSAPEWLQKHWSEGKERGC